MNTRTQNRQIRNELQHLVEQGTLQPVEASRIAQRYPVGKFHVVSLIRWLSILGAVNAGVGLLLLARNLANQQLLIELALIVTTFGSLWGGHHLGRHCKMPRVGAALQLLGAASLQGLSFVVAREYSDDSGNWPAVVGLDCLMLLGLAYGLSNRLILSYAAVNAFLWFGGSTGFATGWGVYWLGMTYPVRFLGAAAGVLLVAYLHFRYLKGRYQSFSRVYLHFGLLAAHFSLWFLSLFGYFGEHARWSAPKGELVLFTLIWAAVSCGCFFGAVRVGLSTMRGYGLTFLIINLYTFYFQFVIARTGAWWFLHLLLVGGSMVALAMQIERLRRAVASSSE